MKLSKNIIGVMFLILTGSIMSSCVITEEKNSVSVSERIDKFEEDVNNGDNIEIPENFHSEIESSLQTNWYSIFCKRTPWIVPAHRLFSRSLQV